MSLITFLQSNFNEDEFINFISRSFTHFECDALENLQYIEDKSVSSYKFLGQTFLDDEKNIGFFIIHVKPEVNIENVKVALNIQLKKIAQEEMLEGAIAAFYIPKNPKIWRLSFLRFTYDEQNKEEVSNLKRYTYVLGENIPVKTANEQLELIENVKSLDSLQDMFSVEKISKEFYKGLISQYENLITNHLTYPEDSENKKEFAIRLLGRVLFIKFLNKKSLVGNEIFQVLGNYYHEILEPLFFEQLNTPKNERKEEFKNDKIPFLNGGLFEPLGLDYYKYNGLSSDFLNILKIDNLFFIDLYEHLNQFNFTIDENSPDDNELSIDPEMLGRIFENLLAELNPESEQNARKATGSYYTPREIVDYMVSSSLLEYLKTKTDISEDILKTIIFKDNEPKKDYDKTKILSALYELKIIDPACGSGAFPMGLLQKIVKILSLIDKDSSIWFNLQNDEFRATHKDRNKDYIRKLAIIKNTIYGVDIQPIAMEISKLRFFLSLIVEEDKEPEPLPNLEFKFVCANSLLSMPKRPVQDNLFYHSNYQHLEEKLISLKNEYFDAVGQRKNEIKDEYKKTQSEMFKAEEDINLFSALNNELIDYNPFNPLSQAKFFDSDFMFNIKDGFDIVIGNPPYVKEYTNKSAFNGTHELECYKGKMDIWYLFACRGIDLLKTNGILSFIATNNWISNFGASNFRNKILKTTQIKEFIDFGDYKVFENAGIQTMILLTQKEKTRNKYTCIYSRLESKRILKNELVDFLKKGENDKFTIYKSIINPSELIDKNIVFLESAVKSAIDIIEKNRNFYLDENEEVAQGLVTPNDNVTKKSLKTLGNNYKLNEGIFNLTSKEKEKLNFSNKELELIKPLYTSKQIGRYIASKNNEYWVIYTSSKFKNKKEIEPYPNIKKHLDRFKQVITSDFKPYGIHRTRNEYFFKDKKILVLRKCTDRPIFSYVEFDSYVNQAFYVIKSNRINLKYLTAVLNSKLIKFWLRYKGKMQGNNYQVDKEPILNIPIKDISDTKPFEILVDYIMFINKLDDEDNIDKYTKNKYIANLFDNLLDAMVIEIYFTDELNTVGLKFIDYIKEILVDFEKSNDNKNTILDVFLKLKETKNIIRNNLELLQIKCDFAKKILKV